MSPYQKFPYVVFLTFLSNGGFYLPDVKFFPWIWIQGIEFELVASVKKACYKYLPENLPKGPIWS